MKVSSKTGGLRAEDARISRRSESGSRWFPAASRSERLHGARTKSTSWNGVRCLLLLWTALTGPVLLSGCITSHAPTKAPPGAGKVSCEPSHLRISTPELCDDTCNDPKDYLAGPPPTLRNFEELEAWDLSLEECVRMTLSNTQVLNRFGGTVVANPQSSNTTLDPAIVATSPNQSGEAALSAFDAQYQTSIFHGHNEQRFNNVFFGGGANSLNSYTGNYISRLSKTMATGATIAASSTIDYNRNNLTTQPNAAFWTVNTLAELRQPLARNAGVMVNRIAGPNAVPGVYNGVMIGRIREDISMTGFEIAVRNLVRDTVTAYWELYFAYQDLETKKRAREAARNVWETRTKRRMEIDRPDDEAIARQQYFNFHNQVQIALIGSANQPGVIGAERNLRRLMGLNTADGRLIRPITEPTVAEVVFDWDSSQEKALDDRIELRRQKWFVRQRELELCAARNLALWRVDLVGQYGGAGNGAKLWGETPAFPPNPPRPGYSGDDGAIQELFGGELDNWRFGFEIQGPVGTRLGHLGVRNAQLLLAREKTLLREQQRQILHDLSQSYAAVDLAYQTVRTTYNNRKAVFDEYVPKKNRFDFGEEPIFFVLEVTTRAARIESDLHRAVINYNLALLDYALQEDSLLEMFNVSLAEGSDGEISLCSEIQQVPAVEAAAEASATAPAEPSGNAAPAVPAPSSPPAGTAPADPADRVPPASEPVEQPATIPQGAAAIIPIPALERAR